MKETKVKNESLTYKKSRPLRKKKSCGCLRRRRISG